jgi:hypothetical protein
MARKGLHAFTVQEAKNFASFVEWNYQALTLADNDTYVSADYISTSDPAKKVVIYGKPGATAFTGGVVSIKINGETTTKKVIIIDGNDLPFTITGLYISSLALATSDGGTDEFLSVLSYH